MYALVTGVNPVLNPFFNGDPYKLHTLHLVKLLIMKLFSIFFFALLTSLTVFGQDPMADGKAPIPLFALLTKVKVTAEDAMRVRFTEDQLGIDTIGDEPKGNKRKENQRVANFKINKDCIIAYNALRSSSDQLITQLQSDLTVANKLRPLKKLNEGTYDDKWYKATIDQLVKERLGVTNCIYKVAKALTLEEITGLFSVIVDIVKSAKDFRAAQIKIICEQLEKLRLLDVNQLIAGESAKPAKEEKEAKGDKEEK